VKYICDTIRSIDPFNIPHSLSNSSLISFHLSPLLLYDVIGFGNVHISYDSLLNLSNGIGVKNHANYQVCNKMQTHYTPLILKIETSVGTLKGTR